MEPVPNFFDLTTSERQMSCSFRLLITHWAEGYRHYKAIILPSTAVQLRFCSNNQAKRHTFPVLLRDPQKELHIIGLNGP